MNKIINQPRYAWIMLHTKLSTVVAPPRLSIHFSTPWPLVRQPDVSERKRKTAENAKIRRTLEATKDMTDEEIDFFLSSHEDDDMLENPFGGLEHDCANARSIFFRGERIRVFGDECSIISNDHLNEYYPEAYDLVEELPNVEDKPNFHLSRQQREVVDAALVDGCTRFEALMVANGEPIEGGMFPPVGWFKIKPEYGRAFATEDELNVSDRRMEFCDDSPMLAERAKP